MTGSCGDGTVQTNEVCDKAPYGNGIGSYCSADCQEISGSCGDGTVQDNEICDKAEFGDGTGPYYCAADCKKIIGGCGDGTTQPNENCDDGADNGRYGFCNSTCTGLGKRCGDGIKDLGYEECDDGNNEDNDYCSPDCQTLYGLCGDGVIQSNEVCDKAVFGAGTGAYCSSDCQTVLGSCGDEIKQSHEDCDRGDENGSKYCEYALEPPCEICTSVCKLIEGTATFCGDGRIDFVNGEVCDKAEPDVGDEKGIGGYCSFDCTEVLGSCGDGVKQDFEACDKATFNQGIGPEYCSADCAQIIAWCGDGTQQSNEICDLGVNNTDYCDYGESSCTVCSTNCKTVAGIISVCGDSKTDTSNGEVCDNGANNGAYLLTAPGSCNTDCKGRGEGGFCGDGTIHGAEGEECDNGENNGSSFCTYGPSICELCSTSCKTVQGEARYCGDGLINGGENCDNGEENGDYGKCKTDCTGPGVRCGDGNTDTEYGEVCDDGALNGEYGYCAFDCKSEGKRCGDGIKQPEEACDAGVDNGVYRLNAPGNCDSDCQGVGEGGYCGNSSIESPFEDCDHGGIIKTACEYGETECFVCDANCHEQSGTTSYCGDGIKDEFNSEVCDDGTNNGLPGYCNSICTAIDQVCGDGITSGTEACDDGANNGNYGYCNSGCDGWSAYCGDGIKNGDEACDNGENNGDYGYCKADCSAMGPYCGDGVQNGAEFCDNGINNGTYGFCNSGCNGFSEKCGDEILQREDCTGFTECVVLAGAAEACDDGEANGIYGYCDSSCSGMGPFCGDGIIHREDCTGYSNCIEIQGINEDCDSGEDNGKYGFCKLDCSGMNSTCGDGIRQPEEGEQCDDGENNGKYGYCQINCAGPGERCGDAVLQREDCVGFEDCVEFEGAFESCDSGVNNGKYGFCNLDCTGAAPKCGDGVLQRADCTGFTECVEVEGVAENCDDGENNGEYGYCKANCIEMGPYCGDGIATDGEQCDNGQFNGETDCPYGFTSCKVCSTSCVESAGITSFCGNSNTETDHGEVCDAGSLNGVYKLESPGNCSSNCSGFGSGGYCGDGIKQNTFEGCDFGALNGSTDCQYGQEICNLCTASCTPQTGVAIYCGDGVKQEGYEACDDGTNNGLEGYCKVSCDGYIEYCGDGIKNGTEACDDGENNGNPGYCLADCSAEDLYCGNGVLQTGELCDDGLNNGMYDPDGEGYCNSDCNGYNEGGHCGDGTIQEEEEECDDGLNNGLPGFCQIDCTIYTDCGNGIIDEGEFCDTADVDCSDFAQFSSGTVPCPSDCSIPDFGGCVEDPAYISPFFTTSQTECYDNTGIITCPAEGIPFYGQEPQFDYTIHNFTVNAETITENVTGLTWQKETPSLYTGCTAGDPSGSKCNVGEGWEYCNDLILGGYDDWRLPTAFELSNIMSYSKPVPLIFDDFTGSVSENYVSVGYWYHTVLMSDGTTLQTEKSSAGLVKCVRGMERFANREIFQSDDIFVDVLDNTVPATVFWQYDSAQIEVDWEDALTYCSTLVVGGGGASGGDGLSGFRLPTVVELQSFAFESLYTVPPLVGSGTFWTSTTVHATPVSAYTVDFATGNVNLTGKTGTNFVICVK